MHWSRIKTKHLYYCIISNAALIGYTKIPELTMQGTQYSIMLNSKGHNGSVMLQKFIYGQQEKMQGKNIIIGQLTLTIHLKKYTNWVSKSTQKQYTT